MDSISFAVYEHKGEIVAAERSFCCYLSILQGSETT